MTFADSPLIKILGKFIFKSFIMLQEFNKRFGIVPSLEEEQGKFIERIIVFLDELKGYLTRDDYKALFNTVCIQFGKNPRDFTDTFLGRRVPDLEEITGKNFLGILQLITVLRHYYVANHTMVSTIDETVVGFIKKAEVDLEINYVNGEFYPAKENLLDKELVDFSMNALRDYPDENKDFANALKNYQGNDLSGIVGSCYTCVEGLVRKILNNKKTLINNKVEVLQRLSANDNWKGILHNYIEFGNDYARHASPGRHQLSDKEAESYLYLTGLLIRLLLT